MNGSKESKDSDYNYLIDCETNKQLSKSDSIRSQLFQLNVLQKTIDKNNDIFNKLRLNLMNELSQEIDRSEGKNTYLGPAIHLANKSSRDRLQNEWNSQLFGLTEEQLFQKFNIKKKSSKHIKSKQKTIALKTDFSLNNEENEDIIDIEISDNSVINDKKMPKSNLMQRFGNFKPINNCGKY
jgi:hypothetical protein